MAHMRIIFLNAWHGKRQDGLRDFIAGQVETTDIFCIQEFLGPPQSLFESLGSDWKGVHAQKGERGRTFSEATYVKRPIEVLSSEALLKNIPNVGLGLSALLKTQGGNIRVCNIHGVAYSEDDKLDNSDRLEQSRAFLDHLRPLSGSKVIGGDFNVLPETESIRMFEQEGYIDLIKKYEIKTTRNRLAWEMYPGHEMLFSDYVFVSPDVKIKKFAVPQNEISDHLPLIVDIEN